MSVGENLKRIRTDQAVSQVMLAEEVGVTSSMICAIEQDRKPMTVPLGIQIAKVLKCSLNDFADSGENL